MFLKKLSKTLNNIAYPWCCLALLVYASTAIIYHKNKKTFLQPEQIVAFDAMGYYSYMQWFILEERTLKELTKESNSYYTIRSTNKAGEEVFVNKYSTGISMLLSPFFLIGHSIAKAGNWALDGYSPPYLWCTTFGALFYAFLALIFLARFLLKHFSDPIVAVVLIALVGGTNWWFYIFHHPFMSHNYSCFLFALTLYYSQQWYETGAWKHYIPLAVGVGLIAAVRIPNLAYGIVLVFGGVYNKKSLGERLSFLGRNWNQLVVGILIVIALIFPQLWYWKETTGYYWLNAYQANEEYFYWLQPMLAEVLIGYRKGWFIYTPLMMLAVLGFIVLFYQKSTFFPSILIYILINVYIVSCWGFWWYGGSFGMRALLECSIPMAIPLAALLNWAKKQAWSRAFFFGALLLFISLNLLQTHQYALNILHYQSMTRKAYWHSFGKLPPYSKAFKTKNDSLFQHPNVYLESHRKKYVSTIW